MSRIPALSHLASLLTLILLIGALAAPAFAEKSGEEILALAFERADANQFQPLSGQVETHNWVYDSKERLKRENRQWSSFILWRPDSTQVLEEGEEVIFTDEEKDEKDEDEAEKEKKKRERKIDPDLKFLQDPRREEYKFEYLGSEERFGRELAVFKIKPVKKKKGYWKGRFWIDPANGDLAALDMEPVKRKFGLKRLQATMDFTRVGGTVQPVNVEMNLEVKVPFIVHHKIRTTTVYRDYALIKEGELP